MLWNSITFPGFVLLIQWLKKVLKLFIFRNWLLISCLTFVLCVIFCIKFVGKFVFLIKAKNVDLYNINFITYNVRKDYAGVISAYFVLLIIVYLSRPKLYEVAWTLDIVAADNFL